MELEIECIDYETYNTCTHWTNKNRSIHTSSIIIYPIHVMYQWNELKSNQRVAVNAIKQYVSLRNLINKTLCKLRGKM